MATTCEFFQWPDGAIEKDKGVLRLPKVCNVSRLVDRLNFNLELKGVLRLPKACNVSRLVDRLNLGHDM